MGGYQYRDDNPARKKGAGGEIGGRGESQRASGKGGPGEIGKKAGARRYKQ